MIRKGHRKYRPNDRALKTLFFLAIALCTYILSGQEEARFITFNSMSGSLILNYQNTFEQTYEYDVLSTQSKRTFFNGGLQLSTSGSIYHSNLLFFNINFTLLGLKSKNEFLADTETNNSINNNYNIHLSILQKKKINLSLFALRSFSTTDRINYGRFFTVFKKIGGTINAKTKRFPFRLELYKTESKSESISYLERDEKVKNADLQVDLLDLENISFSLTGKWKDFEEYRNDLKYFSTNLNLNFRWMSGKKQRNSLLSFLHYNKMSKDYDLNIINFHNIFNYYFTDKFNLILNYSLENNASLERSDLRHNLSGSVRHQLFSSLNSEFLIGDRIENSIEQKIRAMRYQYSLNYVKKFPTGILNLHYYKFKENGKYLSSGGIGENSERADFSITDSIILTRMGIDPGTIILLDQNLSTLYVLGADYEVELINNLIYITRLPGGRIEPGAEIVIRYSYFVYPDFNLNIRSYRLNARIVFLKYLSLYYRKSSRDQDVTSRYSIPPFESYDKDIWGAKVSHKLFRLEYYKEKYNSNTTIYNSTNYRAAVNLPVFRWLKFTGNMSLNRLDFLTTNLYTNFDSYIGEISFTPNNNFIARGIYRKINYDSSSNSYGRESIIGKLSWNIRRITIELYYEHILNGYGNSERLHNFFNLMIRRSF